MVAAPFSITAALTIAVHQQALGGFPVGAVGGLDLAAVQEQALAAGQAGVTGRSGAAARPSGARSGLASGAGHADHWARGRRRPSVEQVIDDGLAHRARLAYGGLEVHQQAGAGVDLDDGAALCVPAAWTMSCATRSMPAMSRPTTRAARQAR